MSNLIDLTVPYGATGRGFHRKNIFADQRRLPQVQIFELHLELPAFVGGGCVAGELASESVGAERQAHGSEDEPQQRD